ncbi:MAG: GDSL-type esterase/lipase family protein [Saprospiraceae bacterium]
MQTFPTNSEHIQWFGRTLEDKSGNRQLISSASGLKFRFTGEKCEIWLRNLAQGDDYNYISIVLDGIHQERKAIHFDTFTSVEIKTSVHAPFHDVELYKETEAVCGLIIVKNVRADSLHRLPEVNRKKIEFIGNSITVGMSADASHIPCMEGRWYDQHNAYNAYGPQVSRALNLDFTVYGVSGIGMYRNSSTDGPTVGNVYEQAYIDPNPNSVQWDFKKFIPDIVTICLGTNDLSEGDGVTHRLPFDSTKFINAYLVFLNRIHFHYPNAKILLLNTPLVGDKNIDLLNTCLLSVKEKVVTSIPDLPISIFSLSMFRGAGCGGHPDVEDHKRMADELLPVIQRLL